MVTAQDSGGIISMFEFIIAPKQGPPLHVHHREDETYYVLTGEFLFEVGGTNLPSLSACGFSPTYAHDVPNRVR